MRMLMTIQMDAEASSVAVRDGRLSKLMESALSQLHPEAAYFTTHEGDRTAYIVFDLQEPAQMPMIAEPFFNALKAKIDWSPVMNADDLREGIGRIK